MPGYQQPYSNQEQQNRNPTPGREREAATPKPHQGQNNMERGARTDHTDQENESLFDLEPQERPRPKKKNMPGREHDDERRDRGAQTPIGQRHDDPKSMNGGQRESRDSSQRQGKGGQPPR